MEKSIQVSISDIAARTRWSVFLHWYMLSALGASGLFSIYIAEGLSERFITNAGLIGAFIFSNFIFYFLARLQRGHTFYYAIVISLIIYELLFITLAMYLNGGLESQIFILYVVPILMATVTLRGLWVYLTALSGVALISIYLWAEYKGWIVSEGRLTELGTNYQYVLNTIVFTGLVILLITYLASYIFNLLQKKERQAIETRDTLVRAQSIAKLGSWEWDIAKDIVTWSEQMYKMFGVRAGSVINFEEYSKRLHPDERDEITATVQRALKNGRSYTITHRIISGNKILAVRGEGRVIKGADGKPIKIIGTTRDITAEQELDRAKNDFVSLASHQLRTPATEVRWLLALLKDSYVGKLTKKQYDLAEKAYLTNERQIKITNDLLGIAQINSGRISLSKSPIELGEWLAGIAKDIQPMVDVKNQQFTYKRLKKPLTIKADANRLEWAIENLIDNASKYTREGGKITLSYKAGPSHAIISVRDNGIGIAKEDQKSIFDIYTRANSRGNIDVGGSGLGLYLVKKLVKLHRGKITVDSKFKSGSTFNIHLPYK